MDSPLRRTEPRRALGTRHRWRLFAVTAWTGFLGGALTVMTGLALLPAEATHGFGWGEMSVAFLCAWILAMVPVSLALMLMLPRTPGRRDDE